MNSESLGRRAVARAACRRNLIAAERSRKRSVERKLIDIPFIPAHSVSKTRVDALLLGIRGPTGLAKQLTARARRVPGLTPPIGSARVRYPYFGSRPLSLD
jgi:hypothetical protein